MTAGPQQLARATEVVAVGVVAALVVMGFVATARAPSVSTAEALLDAAVGAAFGIAALVSPGRPATRLTVGAVGVAWLLESVVTVGAPHQAALMFLLAVFPGPRRDLLTVGAAAVGVPLLLGVLTQAATGAVFLAVAVVRLVVRRGGPAGTLYAVASATAVGLLLLVAVVLQVRRPETFDPSTVLVSYQVLLLAVAAGHVAATWSIAPGLTRRMRPVLDRHREVGGPADADALERLVRRAVGDQALRVRLTDRPRGREQAVSGWETVYREDGRAVALVRFTRTSGQAAVQEDALAAVRLVGTSVSLRRDLERELRELESARARLLRAVDRQRADVLARLRAEVLQELADAQSVVRSVMAREGPSDELAVALGELDSAAQDIGSLVRGEPPRPLGHGALLDALRDLADGSAATALSLPDDLAASAEVETALYYVCAEALANAGKHAGASRVRLSLVQDVDAVSVRVQDDGAGGADPAGPGLTGLAERLHVLGGSLAVASGPEGTTVDARVPYSIRAHGSTTSS